MGLVGFVVGLRLNRAAGTSYSYDEPIQMASDAPAFGALVAVNDERLPLPGDMVSRKQSLCRAAGQVVPDTPAL